MQNDELNIFNSDLFRYEILNKCRSVWSNPISPVLECITTLNGSNALAPFWSISKHNKGLMD